MEKKNKLGLISIILSSLSLVLVIIMSIFMFTNINKDKNNEAYSQYKMYVGTNDKDTYLPMDIDLARNKVDAICTSFFENGYTLFEATGSWKDETDTITHEYTFVCFVSGVSIDTVHNAADKIIVELNQNSIMMESYNHPIEFYK